MKTRQLTILLSLFVALSFITIGILVLIGVFDEKKVSRVTLPIQWKGNFAYLSVKFSCDDSTFSTGNTIHVKPIMFYPTNGSDPQSFVIHFPDSISPSDYQKLVNFQDDLKINQTNTSISYQLPPDTYYGFFGGPLSNQFDLVWTSEGEKSASLYIAFKNKTDTIAIPLTNLINIQSSDVRIQVENSKLSLGLTLIIAAMTILTIIPTVNILVPENKTADDKKENESTRHNKTYKKN